MHKWPAGTTLVCGDSIIAGLEEKKLNSHGNVKLRAFKGATVQDMVFNLVPLLNKKPDHVILHIGTNNCTDESSDAVMKRIDELVTFIESKNPTFSITLSTPTIRFDNSKATLTCKHLTEKIKNSSLKVINNDNIKDNHSS